MEFLKKCNLLVLFHFKILQKNEKMKIYYTNSGRQTKTVMENIALN